MKEIRAILIDGKQVKFPLNYNVKEGWVEFEVPIIDKKASQIESGESVDLSGSANEEIKWKAKKEFGKVEIVYI